MQRVPSPTSNAATPKTYELRSGTDAPYDFQEAAETALVRLDPGWGARLLERRIQEKHQAGLEAALEIHVTGELPAEEAVSVLLTVPARILSRGERTAFAVACQKVKDGRLIPPLTDLLEPRLPDLHWHVVEALRKIDSDQTVRRAGQPTPLAVDTKHCARTSWIPKDSRRIRSGGRNGRRGTFGYSVFSDSSLLIGRPPLLMRSKPTDEVLAFLKSL